jgi:hypothetical protein
MFSANYNIIPKDLKQLKMAINTWNVRNLYRSNSLKTVSRELEKAKVRFSGARVAHNYTFFYGNGNADHHLQTGFFVHKGIISAVQMIEFVTDGLSYIILRGCCHDILF